MARPKKKPTDTPAGGTQPAPAGAASEKVHSGYHAVFEALRTRGISGTVYIAARNTKARDVESRARDRGVGVVHVTQAELARIGGENARGAVLVGRGGIPAAIRSVEDFTATMSATSSVVVVLDGITDPHNVGAILRSADQFDVDLVVTRERRAAADTATLTRTSAGAVSYVRRVTVPNVARALSTLKEAGFWVYGASAEGTPVDRLNLSGRIALVLGSEGEGISRLVRERCDELAAIPAGGNIDSLNVSVAAGVLMYEVRRQARRES